MIPGFEDIVIVIHYCYKFELVLDLYGAERDPSTKPHPVRQSAGYFSWAVIGWVETFSV